MRAGLDLVAGAVAGLEQGIGRGEGEVALVAHHHVAGRRPAVALAGLRRAVEDAEMLEDVAHAALGDAHALDAHPAPAADLGAERQDAAPLDRGGEGGALVDAPEHDVEGRAERAPPPPWSAPASAASGR